MRRPHVLLRGGILAVAGLISACNAIIGVDDVALRDCKVNSSVSLIASDPSTTSLDHQMDGSLVIPSLLFLLNLNTDSRPDALFLQLYDNMGQHGRLNTPARSDLTMADAKLESCGICVSIGTDFDSVTKTFSQTFWALGQGYLTLTVADGTRLKGSMHNLQFRHVNTAGNVTTEIDDGCEVTVDDVEFDMTYSP